MVRIVTNVSISPRSAFPPRLLTRAQAAVYCGVSIPVFSTQCPVRPIALGPSKRLERYDIVALNRWIDEMSGEGPSTPKNWLSLLDSDNERRAR